MSGLQAFAFNLVRRGVNVITPFHSRRWKWIRLGVLASLDTALIVAAYFLSYWLRLDTVWSSDFGPVFLQTAPILVAVSLPVFVWGGMYRQVWRYANFNSALTIVKCVVVSTAAAVAAISILRFVGTPPRSVYPIYVLVVTAALSLSRFGWRSWANFQTMALNNTNKTRCMIYGAGNGGDIIARHIAANPNFPLRPVGFIDDDKNKRGRAIHGLRILGSGADLENLCRDLDVTTILLAIPSAPGQLVRQLIKRCQDIGVKLLIMPDLTTSLTGELQPRPVEIRDLLRRSPKVTDKRRIEQFFFGKTVLITGAGGSIGSELCRQVIVTKPKQIILYDSSEYNLYAIEMELQELGIPDVQIHSVLGSISERRIVDRVFSTFKPNIVLHAAAYKHVPLMECNPLEGMINNVLGTKNLAEAAVAAGVERFLLISSDKAVRPTSIMGATKRACELLIQGIHAANPGRCEFFAVRFGNVLGSSGSVVPRFLEQIKSGGPVTVTHPEMTRYFMLIDEAVGLVLQAAVMSSGGEIFVLNMGEPVKIHEMARQLIMLAGKEPDKDIEITFTGLRPGEKLYEELILEGAEEHTVHDDIFVARPRHVDPETLLSEIEELIRAAQTGQHDRAVSLLRRLAADATPATEGTSEPRGESQYRIH